MPRPQHPTLDVHADGHVHTRLCRHARGEMEDYVRAAIGRRLTRLIFLEHLELGIRYFERTWLEAEDFAAYRAEGERLQKAYAGVIEIGLGLEVGYNPARREEILAFLSQHAWVRVGLSFHFLEVEGLHYNLVSRKPENMAAFDRFGPAQVVERYYQILLEALEVIPATSLCHVDAVLRHHPAVDCLAQPALLDGVLAKMAEKKVALEVNTSGVPLRGEPYPSYATIEKAVRLGIPLVFGSDAHRPEDVGRSFAEVAARVEKFFS